MPSSTTAIPARPGGGPASPVYSRRLTVTAPSHNASLLESLSETQAAMLDAIFQGNGVAAVAELAAGAVGGPVAVLLPRMESALAPAKTRDVVDVSALECWMAGRLRGRPSAIPAEIVVEVPMRFRDELVGVVVLLASEAAPRSEAYEFLRVAAVAAVTGLAIEDAKEQIEHNLRGSLFEELRSRNDLSGPEIVRRASRLGCDLSGGAVMLCAELTIDRPRLVVATAASEYPGALAHELHEAGDDGPPRVYAALPAAGHGDVPRATLLAARRLAERLRPYGTVGLSSFHSDSAELGCAVREAELMLDVLKHTGTAITDEIGSGTYKLLFRVLASHPEEVREFYDTTIGSLAGYDELNRTDLIRTLGAYLRCNCNMNATAAAIFAHRHTIAYRLERIHELTGLDPLQCEDRERLGLGLKVHRVLAPQLAPKSDQSL